MNTLNKIVIAFIATGLLLSGSAFATTVLKSSKTVTTHSKVVPHGVVKHHRSTIVVPK
jgi:hypothetical protein